MYYNDNSKNKKFVPLFTIHFRMISFNVSKRLFKNKKDQVIK